MLRETLLLLMLLGVPKSGCGISKYERALGNLLDKLQGKTLDSDTDFYKDSDFTEFLERELRKKSENNNREDKETLEAAASVWADRTDAELRKRMHVQASADWNYENNLTDENEKKANEVSNGMNAWMAPILETAKEKVKEIGRFKNKTLEHLLNRLIRSQGVPIAKNDKVNERITELQSELSGIYGKATVERNDNVLELEPDLSNIMAESRDYEELKWAWKSWRDVTGQKMKEKYSELTELMNEAATDNGLDDVGQAWRITNFGEDNIEPMADDLFAEIKPLYTQLHAYVRRRLLAIYPGKFDPNGPIPAHILGGMWAQQWNLILESVLPYPNAPTYDVTGEMVSQKYDANRMFEESEKFFTSLGLESMTDDFWIRSVIEKPDDRDIICHASAWDFYTDTDFRIKMCTEIKMDYLQTIHHEMGHIQYFMQYRHQPVLYRDGANAAFHEAIGDTMALSVMTPQHLKAVGLLEEDLSSISQNGSQGVTEAEINFLMKMALEKVAFLPFGYMIDKYRWEIFRGNIKPENYNKAWWLFREHIQGIKAPVERTEDDFDAGAKYHVAASVPYIRYFLSFIGQFQFQESLCKAAGHQGALHTCDIYQSKAAGDLLKSALRLGASKPWRDVMQVFTGERKFSTRAILEYFRPLQEWLENENEGHHVGW